MKVIWPHKVSVRAQVGSDQLVYLEPGDPFDMPDDEALARVAAGNVAPLNEEEMKAAKQRIAAKKRADAKNAAVDAAPIEGVVLESKPEGIVLEQKHSAKKLADKPADKAGDAA